MNNPELADKILWMFIKLKQPFDPMAFFDVPFNLEKGKIDQEYMYEVLGTLREMHIYKSWLILDEANMVVKGFQGNINDINEFLLKGGYANYVKKIGEKEKQEAVDKMLDRRYKKVGISSSLITRWISIIALLTSIAALLVSLHREHII